MTTALALCGMAFMVALDIRFAQEEETEIVVEQEVDSVPIAGMSAILKSYAEASEDSAVDYLTTTALANSAETNEYINDDGDSIGKYIVCTAEAYASVYTEADETSEEYARLYTYDVATLISNENGWCKIVSGDIEGYVKAELFAFGADAEALDASTYKTKALINAENVYAYQLKNSRSTVKCVLSYGYEYTVAENDGSGWIKLSIDGVGEYYVSAANVLTYTGHSYAITVEQANANAAAISAGVSAAAAVGPSFVWPLPYTYGVRYISSYYGARGSGYHYGIDIGCPSGTSIYAAMDGVVVANYYSATEGNAIVISYGSGIYTLYFHMCKRSDLAVGTSVTQGQVIGYVGSTGRFTGPHLHFAVGVGGYSQNCLVDPTTYLGI